MPLLPPTPDQTHRPRPETTVSETELPTGPRPTADDDSPTTPAVAAARRQLVECQVAETMLAGALADVELVVQARARMGVGICGARNAPAPAAGGPSLPMGPVAALVAQGFQSGAAAIADLFVLLAAVRQAGPRLASPNIPRCR